MHCLCVCVIYVEWFFSLYYRYIVVVHARIHLRRTHDTWAAPHTHTHTHAHAHAGMRFSSHKCLILYTLWCVPYAINTLQINIMFHECVCVCVCARLGVRERLTGRTHGWRWMVECGCDARWMLSNLCVTSNCERASDVCVFGVYVRARGLTGDIHNSEFGIVARIRRSWVEAIANPADVVVYI